VCGGELGEAGSSACQFKLKAKLYVYGGPKREFGSMAVVDGKRVLKYILKT
jgi:hypothetical protein